MVYFLLEAVLDWMLLHVIYEMKDSNCSMVRVEGMSSGHSYHMLAPVSFDYTSHIIPGRAVT